MFRNPVVVVVVRCLQSMEGNICVAGSGKGDWNAGNAIKRE